MRILRLELAQLAEVATKPCWQLLGARTDTDVDASIAEHHGTGRVDERERVIEVGKLVCRQLRDRRPFGLHPPRREVRDHPHRRCGGFGIWIGCKQQQ